MAQRADEDQNSADAVGRQRDRGRGAVRENCAGVKIVLAAARVLHMAAIAALALCGFGAESVASQTAHANVFQFFGANCGLWR